MIPFRVLLPLLPMLAVLMPAPGAEVWAAEHGTAEHRTAVQGTVPDPGAFRRAEGTRAWAFPRDHGGHPAYRLEWWYYTGIVATAQGRRFGYQVTFFRQGLRQPPGRAEGGNAWVVRALYLGHAAVSDLEKRTYHHARRLGRDSLGLSGAARDRHAVWLGRWRADAAPGPAADPHAVRLRVAARDFSLHLRLAGNGPPVLHGKDGLDRKGPAPGTGLLVLFPAAPGDHRHPAHRGEATHRAGPHLDGSRVRHGTTAPGPGGLGLAGPAPG